MNKTKEMDELVAGMYDSGYIAVYDETGQLFFKYMKELIAIDEEGKKAG